MLTPIIIGLIYPAHTSISRLLTGFALPGVISVIVGIFFKFICRVHKLSLKDSMFICTLSWVILSFIGAIPFTVILKTPFLDAVFETMSGYTTTGITMLTGLDDMPRSILFWRALTQWIGGLGILSMFILLGFKGGAAANKLFTAEGHKIASKKPFPGMFHTAKILWIIYICFTLAETLILLLLKLNFFDALTHALTTMSTGGYSNYDSSIAHFQLTGYPQAHLIELTILFFMLLGGINFFIHFRFWTGDLKSVWDNTEMRYFWSILLGSIVLIYISHVKIAGFAYTGLDGTISHGISALLLHLKDISFQVITVISTTGFGTRDIGTAYFAPIAKQIFLVLMFIGGCAGSTGGGFKIIRVSILMKLVNVRLFRLNSSRLSRSPLTIDKELVNEKEIQMVTTLFFVWILLLLIGGGITALFSDHTGWQSFSGMLSALGNIGPCYMSVSEIIALHPVIKITYIFGMLAGRLEIIPVILLFSRKFYR